MTVTRFTGASTFRNCVRIRNSTRTFVHVCILITSNSITVSRADNRVKVFIRSNVSETNCMSIVKAIKSDCVLSYRCLSYFSTQSHVITLTMGMQSVSETLNLLNPLTRLCAPETFIEFCRPENFKEGCKLNSYYPLP